MSDRLGDFEFAVLLAMLRLGDEAYGVSIRHEIESRSGRESSLGAVYTTLDRLEGKGFVTSRMGLPTTVRGGRRKKLCRLTPAGERALSLTWDTQRRMAEGLEDALKDMRRAPDARGDRA